jgi:hypothetical protein
MKIVSVEAKPGSYRVGMRIMRDCVSGPAIGRATTGDVTVPATGSSQIQFGLQLVQGN